MLDIDDVLASATSRKARVRLCLDGDLLDRHTTLVAELEDAVDANGDTAETVALAEQVKALEAEIDAAKVEFVFRSMGRKAYTDLQTAHPAPKDQPSMPFAETFPNAAIAASCVEPVGLTAEKLDRLEEIIGQGEWSALWAACMSVNIGRDQSGESLAASAVIERCRPKSKPRSKSASPVPSSSDGS